MDSLISGTILTIGSTVRNVHPAHRKKIIIAIPLLLAWYRKSARDLPWRRTTDPYAIWISEIMLQQTQVKTVIPYFERWMKELPTITALAKTPEQHVLKLWAGLGYYSRARNLHKAAKSLKGPFPTDFETIQQLPGIGRYTAGAIASIAFNQPAPILDGNVIRVLSRLFAFTAPARKIQPQLWKFAEAFVTSTSKHSNLNQSIMELGAMVCTPRNFSCPVCPLSKICSAKKQNKIHLCPNLEKPKPVTHVHRIAFLAEKNGKILLYQRAEGEHNAGLWAFPAQSAPVRAPVLKRFRHTITTYRVTVDLCAGMPKKIPPGARWVTWSEAAELPMASIDQKMLAFIKSQLPAHAQSTRPGSVRPLPAAIPLADPRSSTQPLPAR